MARRRSPGEHGVYWNETHQYYEAVMSLGYDDEGKRKRRFVTAKTKAACLDKLDTLKQEIASGVRTSDTYTLSLCCADWLDALTLDALTVNTYRCQVLKWIDPTIGKTKLKDLTVDDLDRFFKKIAPHLSQRSLVMIKSTLRRSIRKAQARNLVGRNVVELTDLPKPGKAGHPSRALTTAEADKLIDTAATPEHIRMHALVVLGVMLGLRPGELRKLTWDNVDLDERVIHVWKSASRSGYTKTEESKRSLRMPRTAVDALRAHQERQDAERDYAGPLWHEEKLVFCHEDGRMYNRDALKWRFGKVTKAAGLGWWHPHETRHTYASILSHKGVPHQDIADSMGHKNRTTFEAVYRHNIAPEIQGGSDVMDDLFGGSTDQSG